jgi:8-oxo-dGTP pyrophosphatase MutT (NUDIX family)
MEAKHINELLEKKVTSIFNSAREAAIREFVEAIGIKLSQLDLFHQLKLLMEEYDRLETLEQASEHPYYIHNHAALTNLLNQFSSRAFLLNVDESDILFDCIKLGQVKIGGIYKV